MSFAIDPNAREFADAYFAKAKDSKPRSTQVVVERGATTWYAVRIERRYCHTNRYEQIIPLNLFERRKKIIKYVSDPRGVGRVMADELAKHFASGYKKNMCKPIVSCREVAGGKRQLIDR